ncbi:MAG: hypothetical protein KME10_18220 [Plectolyngbya sp. WJT66-NPBG17]|nr:hypothetical protein [Plectolyngbya sp. WJT66-NPBG17]
MLFVCSIPDVEDQPNLRSGYHEQPELNRSGLTEVMQRQSFARDDSL